MRDVLIWVLILSWLLSDCLWDPHCLNLLICKVTELDSFISKILLHLKLHYAISKLDFQLIYVTELLAWANEMKLHLLLLTICSVFLPPDGLAPSWQRKIEKFSWSSGYHDCCDPSSVSLRDGAAITHAKCYVFQILKRKGMRWDKALEAHLFLLTNCHIYGEIVDLWAAEAFVKVKHPYNCY